MLLGADSALVNDLIYDDVRFWSERAGGLRPKEWYGCSELDVRAKYRMIVAQGRVGVHS